MIETKDLTKKYGEFYAIRGIDLTLHRGDLFGFIGPNGAGKTTTMRILATLLSPTWGEAYVCGHSIHTHPKDIRRLIGYMPDFFGVYDDMRVIEYLEFFAAAYRIHGPRRRRLCEELLETVNLTFKRQAMASTLSRGQTQRLGLARVLLHDPQVLLLDEPLSGLDPLARIDMRNLMKQLRDTGKTLIVSSHILPELADVCNKIGIIHRGELQVNSSVEEVMRQIRRSPVVHVQVREGAERAAEVLGHDPRVAHVDVTPARLIVTLHEGTDDFCDLAQRLIAAGFAIREFREDQPSLEAAFMMLTKGTQ